ncbi:MAG: M48 family metallopeptidase, partial [Rickettsiaceae bacterium]
MRAADRAKNLPEFVKLNKLGNEIKVSVRLSLRAKRISIKIKRNGPELVIPNTNLNQAYMFLLSKEGWVRQKLSIIERAIDIDHNILPYLGQNYTLKHINDDASKVQIQDQTIYVYSAKGKEKDVLIDFLKSTFLVDITRTINILAYQENLKFSKIKISNSKTSWGKCTSNGIISLNWRLILAPRSVLYYVIVHELCHLCITSTIITGLRLLYLPVFTKIFLSHFTPPFVEFFSYFVPLPFDSLE